MEWIKPLKEWGLLGKEKRSRKRLKTRVLELTNSNSTTLSKRKLRYQVKDKKKVSTKKDQALVDIAQDKATHNNILENRLKTLNINMLKKSKTIMKKMNRMRFYFKAI